MTKEIERKFLLTPFEEFPYKKTRETELITQSYVSITDMAEVRIRKVWTKFSIPKYTMTYKNGNGLARDEVEFEINKDTYEDLLSKSEPITKTRRYYDVSGTEVSVDVYAGAHIGLVIAEVEFESEKDAMQYKLPIEYEFEVTEDKRYKNKYLWKEIQ